MDSELTERPRWWIDRILDGLIGEDVRVAARALSPIRGMNQKQPRLTPVRDLFLADNSQAAGMPVYFKGRLQRFVRQIGVVFVWLDTPTLPETATDGPIYFRGKMAVVLRGPAVVELAFPFQVERLPADRGNYWRDLRLPRAQFEFPFAAPAENCRASGLVAPAPADLQVTAAAPERCLAPVDSPTRSAVDGTHGEDAVKGERCQPQPQGRPTPMRNWNCSRSMH